jgi:hypothetical protein
MSQELDTINNKDTLAPVKLQIHFSQTLQHQLDVLKMFFPFYFVDVQIIHKYFQDFLHSFCKYSYHGL